MQLLRGFRLHCKNTKQEQISECDGKLRGKQSKLERSGASNGHKHRVKTWGKNHFTLTLSLHLTPESKRARTVVLDLQGDEFWFQGPFRRGAIHTEVDVSEIREGCPCEVAAPPDSARDDVSRAFLCMFQFLVPAEETDQTTHCPDRCLMVLLRVGEVVKRLLYVYHHVNSSNVCGPYVWYSATIKNHIKNIQQHS